MKLLSWNVARRVRRLEEQVRAVREAAPDVVALQEVTQRTAPVWRERLAGELPHAVCALGPDSPRRHGVLVASRWPLEPCEAWSELPWPESVVAVRLVAGGGSRPLELHAVHVPNARNGWIKVRTLEALLGRWTALRRAAPPVPLVACGDFNTPRRERPHGGIVTFACDRYGRLRPERGERWDAAERAPFVEARELGIVDCFRALHGFERRELTWAYPRWPKSGYRLDHVLASAELVPLRCEYRHDLRTEGLSDHSAVVAQLGPSSPGACSPPPPR